MILSSFTYKDEKTKKVKSEKYFYYKMDSIINFSSNRNKNSETMTSSDDSTDFFAHLNSSSDDSSNSSLEDETIYYKHGKNSSHKKSKKKTDKNCIHVDLADLEASLDLLSKNIDTIPDRVPKSDPVYIAYENVKLFISMFYGREEYPKIIEIMNKYRKPNTINPNTIGSFLFGCSQENYGDINNRLCSPLCLQSILPNDDSSFCPYQVWILTDTTFEPITENNSDRAFIFYNQNNQIPKFTQSQINLLRQQNVRMAQVLKTQDSIHTTIIPMSEIDNLPSVVSTPSSNNPGVVIKQVNNVATVNGTRFFTILIFLILIVVAIWIIFKYILPKTRR